MMPLKTVLKVLILGDPGVGKSCLMHQYVDNSFLGQYKATIGADFTAKDINVGNRHVTLQIWDTAGQERFKSLGVALYRGADCCILVYDVSDPKSFIALDSWRNDFLLHGNANDPENFPFILIGNKIDLDDKVPRNTVEEWIQAKGNMPFFQTSAKDAVNVVEAFQVVAERAVERLNQNIIDKCPDRRSLLLADNKQKSNSVNRKCAC